MVRTRARKALESHGYRVLEAGAAPAALELSERHVGPINLLLTDVVMPGMSGRELAHRLLEVRGTLRMLYMSGYTDDAVLRHGVLEEGMAYLQDRKSTRLNSSHRCISYAVFCLKKKNIIKT